VPQILRPGPGPPLDVHLPRQLLDGVAQFVAGPLDLPAQLVRPLGAACGSLAPRGRAGARPARARHVLCHRCALPLISSTSAFTLRGAAPGVAGVARRNAGRPATASTPAITNSTAVTISAASQTGSTSASAAAPVPASASRPA